MKSFQHRSSEIERIGREIRIIHELSSREGQSRMLQELGVYKLEDLSVAAKKSLESGHTGNLILLAAILSPAFNSHRINLGGFFPSNRKSEAAVNSSRVQAINEMAGMFEWDDKEQIAAILNNWATDAYGRP